MERKEDEIKRMNISRSKDIKDTFVHRQPSYRWIQKMHYKFRYKTWRQLHLNIDKKNSTSKMKTMAFEGRY